MAAGKGVRKMQLLLFIGFWLTNAILFWIIGLIAPGGVVLGNQHVSAIQAGLFAGFLLSTVNILTEPAIELAKFKPQQGQWRWLFVAVNTISIWVITRLALIVGVGINAFWWAVILGVILTFGQWMVWKLVAKK